MPRGTYAANFRLDEFDIDLPGLVTHHDDVVATDRHPDRTRWDGCCEGPSGDDGPNLVCSGCGTEVATRQADCYTQDQVVFHAPAVCVSYAEDQSGD